MKPLPMPCRSTPVYDEGTLPAALRREHRTKAGVWGLIEVIEGELKLHYADSTPEALLTPERPGTVLPEQTHRVELLGPVLVQIHFYDQPPDIAAM